MAIPWRNANPDEISANQRTFFVTSKTYGGRALLQSERMATLFMDVLRSYHQKNVFTIHDFVVMPNHFHLLITVDHNLSVEKAVQLVKGNFSFRAKRELGIHYEIWQRGFSKIRVGDREGFLAHRKYIGENPVRCGLAETPEDYPYSSFYLRKQKRQIGTTRSRALIRITAPATKVCLTARVRKCRRPPKGSYQGTSSLVPSVAQN
jgi:putative transposase